MSGFARLAALVAIVGAIVVALVGTSVGAAGPAAAAKPLGLEHIDVRSQLVARLDLASLNRVLARAGSWNLGNRLAIGLATKGLTAQLGLNPLSVDDWARHGVDAKQPMWFALHVDSGPLEDRYERLLRSDDWSAARLQRAKPAFWRLRWAMSVTNAKATLAWLRGQLPGVTWSPRLGGRRPPGTVVGHAAASALWIVDHQPRRGVLVIDLIRPAFGSHLAEPDPADLLGAARPTRAREAFGLLKGSRAAASLRRPGLTVWLRAESITKLGRALAREAHVAEVAGRPRLRAQGALKSHPGCRELGRAAQRGLFEDASLTVSADGTSVTTHLRYGAAPARLARALPRADHALDAHRRRGARAWAALWTRGPSGLRALPRVTSMRDWPETLRYLRQCAPQHTASARLFAWPELIGLFFDDIARVGPRAATVSETAAGASGVVTAWHVDPIQLTGALEGVLDAKLAPLVTDSLTKVFGEPRGSAGALAWGRGRLRPYLRDGRVGTTLGGEVGADWYATAPKDPAAPWLRGNEIAAAWVNLESSVNALSAWESLFSHLEGGGELRTRLIIEGDTLVLENRITQK